MILLPQLVKLKNWINRYNTYFDNSFEFVQQDGTNGIVHNGTRPVFPADDLGSFFYIRVPSGLQVNYENTIADNGLSVNVGANLFLVAYMPQGDPDKLAANLMATIGRYEANNRITNILIHPEDVINQELSRISPENIEAALQKTQNAALISVNFFMQFEYPFQQLHCITKPCRTC